MDTTKAARAALEAGGYLAICGNAARYRHPQKEQPRKIAIKKAGAIAVNLELFACGALWPFADWYRLPSNVELSGAATEVKPKRDV